jgi:cadmium resistance protein CadD (predicted permease)
MMLFTTEILAIVTVTAGAFVGTNLDNMLLLVALYSRYQERPVVVSAGYFLGMLLIGSICLLIGEVGEVIPIASLGFLGVFPIMIGVIAFFRLFRNKATVDNHSTGTDNSPYAIIMTVLMTQLSNGADSIITFSVLLADSSDAADYLIASVFLGMTGIFAWVAYFALKHRRLSEFLRKYGNFLTPFILVLVGFYILSNTASDLMPG